MKAMRILVRNRTTSQYIKTTGFYTSAAEDAVDFYCKELANAFCDKHKLIDHEVLIAEDAVCDW